MATIRARSPVLWLRRILLMTGILGVAALGVMLGAYRFGRAGMEDRRNPALEATRIDGKTVTVSEGFDFSHTIEGRRVFRIRAAKSSQDVENTAYLETVVLDIYRDNDETYRITSNTARVNEKTWEARLEGDVAVSGWGDLELHARALELRQGGRILRSVGAVEFRYPPDLVGRASRLTVNRKTDTIVLDGGVHIRSAPGSEIPKRLDCGRLILKRGEGMIRAVEDVFLQHGGEEISARVLTLFLDDDQQTLRTLRAQWNVTGATTTQTDFGGESRVDFFGQRLEILPVPENPAARRLLLQAGEKDLAWVRVAAADGLARTLSGRTLEGETRDGRLVFIEGRGRPLVFDEYLDMEKPYPLRQVCADRATARFADDGSLNRIFLEGQIDMWSTEFHLSGGSQALLKLDSGDFEIDGPTVELNSYRGDLAAPRITYSRASGLIRATQGVRASLLAGSTAAMERTPFGQGEGPIRLESEEAVWTADPPGFSFLGGVRAWRGKNLLLAEQLRGDQTAQEMSASGGVKTVWFTSPRSGLPSVSPADRPPAAAAPRPIEVRSQFLTYRRGESTVVYSGRVRLRQDRMSLTCDELAVELEPEGREARRMICRGDVRLEDPVQGRRVQGDTAVYTVAAGRVEIFGEKVRLRDSKKNQMTGKYLVYDLAAGTVRLRSQRPDLSSLAPVETNSSRL